LGMGEESSGIEGINAMERKRTTTILERENEEKSTIRKEQRVWDRHTHKCSYDTSLTKSRKKGFFVTGDKNKKKPPAH